MSLYAFVFVIQISVLLVLNKVSAHKLADVQSKDNKVARVTTIINQTSNATSRIASAKRWQVSRVTQKRYEIINVLWRKTKIFDDVEITSIIDATKKSNRNGEAHSSLSHNLLNQNNILPYLKKSSSLSTPSYIEFHYSDLNDERFKRKNSDSLQSFNTNTNKNIKMKNEDLRSVINSPLFVFHVQYETCKPTDSTGFTSRPLSKHSIYNMFVANKTNNFHRKFLDIRKDDSYLNKNYDAETCPATTSSPEIMNASSTFLVKNTDILTETSTPKSKTIYDKIKFFEIYDSDTPTPHNGMNIQSSANSVIDLGERILLKNVNFDMRNHNYNKTRFVKKHVHEMIPIGEFEENVHTYYSDKVFSTSTIPTQTFILTKHSYISRPAVWSDFPFVAVYVHEPSQVRCDAAAISPHWLLAAGSCLSRHYKNTYSVDGQSAYVVYCADNWRNSERITYVKHSFIHPRFDLRDGAKRHLYNIGVIQIVNSMAETCNGWAPISLMSHKISGQPQGAKGVAVGWGLDRYDASYTLEIKTSLMLYESMVHSETCPGFIGNRNGKIHNLYCLSLPTYSSEINDPVHGAMLLIGGKLIALYLQVRGTRYS